ncbi:MAG: citramalate synthase [Myxococcales bacterium]|nr:citramalate synthase [Myxococcales bacterium]
MGVIIYDTSLRDGTQGEGVQLSVADKLMIAQLVDSLGVSYIEGGWPGSNPRDEAFFEAARTLPLKNARLAAFGSTRRAGINCDSDPNLQALLRAEVPTLTLFGKSWRFQATAALRISPEENLELIEDSVAYLKQRVDRVFFDAEHFFDGYADDPDYALSALAAAERGGAEFLILCDTNGGTLPGPLTAAVRDALGRCQAPIGIHTHNDAELAVANTLAAVEAGATMVQGTINGYGERCGNANLVSILPALVLKMGIDCVRPEQLSQLRHVARAVDEISNRTPWASQPYVGRSAFAHKGGVHVDAIKKDSRTYEHIDPEAVGNHRRILLSDLSGRANVQLKAKELGLELDAKSPETKRILDRVKQLENVGYQFESAGASFQLFVKQSLGQRPNYFQLRDLEVNIAFAAAADPSPSLDANSQGSEPAATRARLEIGVDREVAYTSARGDGPVHAMDTALRSLLGRFYPQLEQVRLVDYKVRVLSSGDGTGSVVRVLLQSSDGSEVWGTVGVSENIIEASWQAMVDALDYKLVKDGVEPYVSSEPGQPARSSHA